jgi:hypothetical protein
MKSTRLSNAHHHLYKEQRSLYTGKLISTQQAAPRSKVENMENVDQNIARIEQIFGRTFHNKLLCAEALQMAGENILIDVGEKQCFVKKNKALESVGDTIIDAVLCKTWYESQDDEGTVIPGQIGFNSANNSKVSVLQSALGTRRSASAWPPTSTSLASAWPPKSINVSFTTVQAYESQGQRW